MGISTETHLMIDFQCVLKSNNNFLCKMGIEMVPIDIKRFVNDVKNDFYDTTVRSEMQVVTVEH